jgi:CRP-like cAMP-binding protein
MGQRRRGAPISYVDARTLLSETPLFRVLEPALLDEVVRRTKKVSFIRSQILFNEGDEANELFVIASGRIGIVKKVGDNKESIVALMERGDLLGEMSLFDNQGRSATARALERTEVFIIPFPLMRAALQHRPQAMWAMVELIAKRLRSADETLANAMFLDVTGRTARRLLEFSRGRHHFYLPLTQEELAGLVGASRERVNKALSSLIKEGVLSVEGHTYTVIDKERFLEISDV